MILCIGNVLNKNDLDFMDSKLQGATFIDGRVTAGWSARLVKNNEQAKSDDALDELRATLEKRILGNEVFQLAAQPKVLTPILISRYAPGRQYGTHVDDALMSGVRTDLSFTLFLSEPDTYEGGELVMETSSGEQPYKLPAGAMIVYPSTTLHCVRPVETGLRVAAVGWVRSYIRSAECREILFDLETARREMFQREGKTPAFDLLSKCSSNLLRLWVED
ncbi:MAG: Fe2+-dependent dioxygenase [Beijerinckiaceae bacterium]|nr:Fe2+-dependent dioxygenase [Beijerinckiaceae bacterium]